MATAFFSVITHNIVGSSCEWCGADRHDVEDNLAPFCISPDPARRALQEQVRALINMMNRMIGEAKALEKRAKELRANERVLSEQVTALNWAVTRLPPVKAEAK